MTMVTRRAASNALSFDRCRACVGTGSQGPWWAAHSDTEETASEEKLTQGVSRRPNDEALPNKGDASP